MLNYIQPKQTKRGVKMNNEQVIKKQISSLLDELEIEKAKEKSKKKKPFFSTTSVSILISFIIAVIIIEGNEPDKPDAPLTDEQLMAQSISNVNWEISKYRDAMNDCSSWKIAIKTNASDIQKMDSKCAQADRYLIKQNTALQAAYDKHGEAVFTQAYKLRYPI